MTKEQLFILRHSIGLDENGHRQFTGPGYVRNWYCEDIENGVPAPIQGLIDAGLMKAGRKINAGTSQYFYVTDAGRREALKDVVYPKLTRSQKRYRAFLEADSNLSFGEWLKCRRYQHA